MNIYNIHLYRQTLEYFAYKYHLPETYKSNNKLYKSKIMNKIRYNDTYILQLFI